VSRCAQISRLLSEPVAGTAPSSARWLCLEWPGAWPSDINQVPAAPLLARATAAGFRPLLIRGDRRRVLLTDASPPGATTTVVEGWDDDLALPAPGEPLPGEPLPGPLLLVCAHAERDPCCGLDGQALLDALAGPDVVACSHLGGHRFAPTAMVLPTGYVYGRLDPATARRVHDSAAAGEVETERCRGRSTWSPAGQVAELAVRAATGLAGPDDLVMIDDRGDTVHLNSTAGGRWAVDVERVELDATRPASCGGRPTLAAGLRAAAVRTLRGSR
jgi:(2Fe-2S) ferredoxin